MICEYCQTNEATHLLKNGKWCCKITYNQCPEIRRKNSEGLKKAYSENRKTVVFTEKHRKASQISRISNLMNKPFEVWGDKLQYQFLLEKQEGKCNECGISNWNNKPIRFHKDHIDGNTFNNTEDNFRLLCPNCHSQTETYCGKNINTGKTKVSDSQLLEIYDNCKNIHQTLLQAGLAAKGGNYTRMYKLLSAVKET